ncbi:hypothetical protein AOQ84DRAFT_364435 [Glonium stellatum]|uniref:Uncharacterized protein n=1 Tax=Glonium stellatum TaxID=574774 RepID=A0A8E2JSQ6_9PEZI|nr:hypothetical protein AOQ84DRAFT_364435 [Glonium stellatum]
MPNIPEFALELFLAYALCSFVYFVGLCFCKRPTSKNTTRLAEETPFRVRVRLPGPWLGLSGPRLGGEMAIFEQTYFSDLTIKPVKPRKHSDPTLLGLPCELRDMVYAYVLTEPDGLHYDEMRGQLRGYPSFDGIPNIAINYVCRQLRDETLHLAFKLNTIWFGHLMRDTGAESSIARFILFMERRSHTQRGQMRHIMLIENLEVRNNDLSMCAFEVGDVVRWCRRYPNLRIKVHITPGYMPYGYATPPPLGHGLDNLRDLLVMYRRHRLVDREALKISIEVPTMEDAAQLEDDMLNHSTVPSCYLWFHENLITIEEINGRPWNPWNEEAGLLHRKVWEY